MTTRATATLQTFADTWELMFASAIFSGIVGDAAHVARGGYHVSIADNPAGNYSITRKDDAAPPGTWPRDCASAVDMNLGLADMKTCHLRLRAVFGDRGSDPRAKYINGWNGWDGSGNAGRYDIVTGSISAATDDHKWHLHLEFRRRYVNDGKATAAVLSILRGESAAEYEGADMPLTNADVDLILNRDVIPNPYSDAATNPTIAVKNALKAAAFADAKVDRLAVTVAAVAKAVAELTGKDFTDEQAIVQGVLAGLTGDQVADMLRRAYTPEQLADLAGRLQSTG